MAIPKPVAIDQESPGTKVLISVDLLKEINQQLAGVLADLRLSNPRIRPLNPIAWERWMKIIVAVMERLNSKIPT